MPLNLRARYGCVVLWMEGVCPSFTTTNSKCLTEQQKTNIPFYVPVENKSLEEGESFEYIKYIAVDGVGEHKLTHFRCNLLSKN